MTESAPIATDQFARAAKAAGDNLRLSILKLLGQGSFGVMELCEVFGIKQSGMSHHLKVLSQAGLVTTRREGNSTRFCVPARVHVWKHVFPAL